MRFRSRTTTANGSPSPTTIPCARVSCPPGVTMSHLTVNLVPLADDSRLLFSPSGVNQPFTLQLESGGNIRRVSADALGNVNVEVPTP